MKITSFNPIKPLSVSGKVKKAPKPNPGTEKESKKVPETGTEPDKVADEVCKQMCSEWEGVKSLSSISLPVESYGKLKKDKLTSAAKKALKHLFDEYWKDVKGSNKTWYEVDEVITSDDENRVTFKAVPCECDDEEDVKESVSFPESFQDYFGEAGKKWLAKADLKKGALHKQLGVKEGEKIPLAKLQQAAKSKDKTLAKRARFALNARTFKHSKKTK